MKHLRSAMYKTCGLHGRKEVEAEGKVVRWST